MPRVFPCRAWIQGRIIMVLRVVYEQALIEKWWANCLKCCLCPHPVRPQERRSSYEPQFHPGPSQADHDSLDSKRPRLDQVSDSHYQRVGAAAVLPLLHPLQEGLRSSDLKKVNVCV